MGRIKWRRLAIVFNILLSLSTPVLSQFAAPESAPYDITAKAMNRNKALIQWRAPLQPNGDIEVSSSNSLLCWLDMYTHTCYTFDLWHGTCGCPALLQFTRKRIILDNRSYVCKIY